MFQTDRNYLPRSKPRREAPSRWSISCGIIVTIRQNKNLIIMKSEKVNNDGRKRTKKGGRPVKGAAEKLKYRITVKMATEEYYLLKSKAKSAGVSASEFVRGCITEGGVKERLTKEHGDLIRKLCGMANNLNQLARKANAEGDASVFMPCRTLMMELDNLVNRIRL